MRVERVDSAWIHGRGADPHHEELRSTKIVVVGCGSVGAPIVQHLAMAGIGRLVLVDPQDLEWANIGRHPLGAEGVGKNKATVLAKHLQLNYPHAKIEGFKLAYHDFFSREGLHLTDADLIVCATADWEMERLLNLQHRNGEVKPPILYTWTEPHACAGHAIIIRSSGACLQCGMTVNGDACATVTVWPTTKQNFEPACGAVFQPYGPVELQGTISLAASLALDCLLGKTPTAVHRVWAGSRALLTEAGGDWSQAWRKGHPEREKGGQQEEWTWEKDDLCPVCSGNGTGEVRPSILEIPGNGSSLLPPSLIT
jgi:molybdopterin/thiamine biosynthesis adenylyltransferase